MPLPIIDTDYTPDNELCGFGCGQSANFRFLKSGRLCCCRSHNSCPENRRKSSNGLKNSGRDYKADYLKLPQESKDRINWAKGLTKETDERIAKMAKRMSGKRRITDKNKLEKIIYREQCNFALAGIIHLVKGYDLLKEYGMYSKKNPNGVVRDHRVSINYGFKNKIDPSIISHPANCEFISHKSNARKTWKSSVSLEELLEDIKNWCG